MAGKRIIYTPDFKQFTRQHPGLIGKFLEAYKNNAEKADFEGASITKLRNLPGQYHRGLWQVKAEGYNFFVKEGKSQKNHDGYSQFICLQELSTIKNDKVDVIKPYFGFSGEKTSFLVVDFCDLPVLGWEDRSLVGRIREMWRKTKKLHKALYNFSNAAYSKLNIGDLHPENAFLDEKNRKIIVFDPRSVKYCEADCRW
ncbi:Uncharacterised protein [uncultured archaeon]|nr:Uncharacterised protein [uncultured archaeon]